MAPGGLATPVNSFRDFLLMDKTQKSGLKANLKDIDFRRGASGEGRVVVDLPKTINQIAIDPRFARTENCREFLQCWTPRCIEAQSGCV